MLHSLLSNGPALLHFLLHAYLAVLTLYFIAGNGLYLLLTALSLGSVWLHKRSRNYESPQLIRQSPATPPVTIIMAACDEQKVIVDSVRSVLKTDYPGLRICVVDDGSSDATLDRLIH